MEQSETSLPSTRRSTSPISTNPLSHAAPPGTISVTCVCVCMCVHAMSMLRRDQTRTRTHAGAGYQRRETSQCEGLECRGNVVVWTVHLFDHAHLLPSFRDGMGQHEADACLYSARVEPFPFLLQDTSRQIKVSRREHRSPRRLVATVRIQSCCSRSRSAPRDPCNIGGDYPIAPQDPQCTGQALPSFCVEPESHGLALPALAEAL